MSFDGEWTESPGAGPVGDSAGALRDQLDEGGHLAEHGTHAAGLVLRGPGFVTGRALIEVSERWRSQTDQLRAACHHIARRLRESAR
ncbi:hypothetical protein [Streptomyces sp. NBC_01803]|uniref:hypothetical protein n=1 Tax=Streptomyces sp. NBC_01803 TaxID=2975946 RepID=UPI002DD9DF05|nr:hypothetical protein [Streptomyces sp. NBC_01803]WSA46943.1 hypothetical protein OIE51_23845 [Streptomyces sp. NBC_01803]